MRTKLAVSIPGEGTYVTDGEVDFCGCHHKAAEQFAEALRRCNIPLKRAGILIQCNDNMGCSVEGFIRDFEAELAAEGLEGICADTVLESAGNLKEFLKKAIKVGQICRIVAMHRGTYVVLQRWHPAVPCVYDDEECCDDTQSIFTVTAFSLHAAEEVE